MVCKLMFWNKSLYLDYVTYPFEKKITNYSLCHTYEEVPGDILLNACLDVVARPPKYVHFKLCLICWKIFLEKLFY